MNRVLLPTDFSENAWNAILYALAILKNAPCDFFVFNAYQVGSSGLMTKRGQARDTRYFNLMKEESARKLDGLLQKIMALENVSQHTFHTISKSGDLISAMGSTVLEERIHCIIMGTKGTTGLKAVFMGSNAHKVIKTIDFCPIITVPNQWELRSDATRLLLATSFQHLFEGYELKPLLDIVRFLKSKVLVGYVGDLRALSASQQSTKTLIERYFQPVRVEFESIEEVGPIHHSIQKHIQQNVEIGMLAMINYRHSFIERLMHEPTIKKVTFNCPVPLLLTHSLE